MNFLAGFRGDTTQLPQTLLESPRLAPTQHRHQQYRLESPRLAPTQHRHQQYRLESPRLARLPRDTLRSSSLRSCGACGPGVPRASRPLSFPPCRLDGPSILAGWTDQRTPAGWTSRAISCGWTGCRSLLAGRAAGPRPARNRHTPPQPIRSFAPVGAHSLIHRKTVRAARFAALPGCVCRAFVR